MRCVSLLRNIIRIINDRRLNYETNTVLLFAVGLTANMTVMAGMSTSKVRKETRFLTDKMAYELSLSTQQYNDAYEINYDFIYSVRNIMDYVARGYEWALDDYYEALDIRNDDLRWILSDAQYRRFLGAEYFYRPIYVTGGKWSFRVYVNYPNRSLFILVCLTITVLIVEHIIVHTFTM